ncbi:MAG TPA: zinc ribbon domain-containing protein, partial [Methanomassiliicoccales archaeon]|nr:zinc ribbon domain-containing protein [Methanomassiliicoccales archaeon]
WTTSEESYYVMNFAGNVTGGAQYQLTKQLDKGIYTFGYRYWNGTEYFHTNAGSGPFNANNADVMNLALVNGILYLGFIQIGLFFYMLLILTFFMDRSRNRMMKEVEEAKAKKAASTRKGEDGVTEEKFVCSECGADVPIDASKCPQCGDSFEEEKKDEKCPQCGTVIFPTDKKCWNCGRVLDRKDQ